MCLPLFKFTWPYLCSCLLNSALLTRSNSSIHCLSLLPLRVDRVFRNPFSHSNTAEKWSRMRKIHSIHIIAPSMTRLMNDVSNSESQKKNAAFNLVHKQFNSGVVWNRLSFCNQWRWQILAFIALRFVGSLSGSCYWKLSRRPRIVLRGGYCY